MDLNLDACEMTQESGALAGMGHTHLVSPEMEAKQPKINISISTAN